MVYYSYSLAAGVKEGYIYNLTQNGLWKNKITLKIFSSSLLRSFLAEKVHFLTIEQSTVFIWQRRNTTSKPDIRNHPNVYTRHV